MPRRVVSSTSVFLSLFSLFAISLPGRPASAQAPVRDRIVREVDSRSTFALPGSVSPLARPAFDTGRANASTHLSGMTMYFQPSAEQQAALAALMQAQQTPGSKYYRQWITPAQYAAQFGLSAHDLASATSWLEQQGFSVDRVSTSHNAIVFSGTVAQVESAFQTEIHHYTVRGAIHTANSGSVNVPSALAGVVLSVRGLSDFRPHPLHKLSSAVKSNFNYGSGSSVEHLVAPGDFATIYDLNPLYSAGYTGSGETIAIVGQTAIVPTDVTNFQKASGLTQKAPTLTQVPGSGTSTVDDSNGDEDESDLDVEWSGAVATGATINFIYVGNNSNYSVFDSLQYAIDNDLAPVISISYGACEADLSSSDVTTFGQWFTQANAQGQTIVSAAGDNGATDCEIDSGTGDTLVNGDATQGLAVDFPGSSPEVTSIGGTEFLGDVSSASTYWNSSNSSSNSSAVEYIPEEVWNDSTTAKEPDGGGGGKSVIYGKPAWQTGTGVPSDGARDVPDISLNASNVHDPYVYCGSGTGSSSDPTICTNGFEDSSGNLTAAGGTSFGAPTFAGILAILNQKLAVSGLGNVNPEIYALAGSNYSTAFHDVTTGNNEIPCEIGSTDCTSSPIGYAADTDYDLASGWGSIDATNFANDFTTGTPTTSPLATTVVLTASSTTVTDGTSVSLSATVSADSGSTTPAGTVQFTVNGAALGSAVTIASGVATTTYTPSTAGTYTVVATFTPTSTTNFSLSSATIVITATAPASSSSPSFTLSATNVTVAQGSSGSSTITVTAANGFSGTVAITASGPSTLTNSCFTYTNPTSTAAGSVTVHTSESACVSTGSHRLVSAGEHRPLGGGSGSLVRALAGTAMFSLVFLGIPGLRRRHWPALGAVLILASLTLAVSGCGSSSSTSTSTNAPTGTYTITVTGTNAADSLSSSTTFTLTVD